MLIERIRETSQFYIYGAQVIAYGAYTAIKHLCGKIPEGFVVNNLQNNPTEIEGIKVQTLEEVPQKAFLIVGVTELIQKEVLPYLKEKGYENLWVLTQHEEHLLMSAYYESIGKFPVLSDINGN